MCEKQDAFYSRKLLIQMQKECRITLEYNGVIMEYSFQIYLLKHDSQATAANTMKTIKKLTWLTTDKKWIYVDKINICPQ